MSLQSRINRLEARATAITGGDDVDLAVQVFCCPVMSQQIEERCAPDGSCPPGWRPIGNGWCESPPKAAYSLEQSCWTGVLVTWDAELGQWRGDAYWDTELRLWVACGGE